mmetsp:Transcript_19574/g.36844  ORF Transcript_19574/g.36844 Transcript_19574/m.36844 type:complete len:183 (+) Transcript_19574:1426-1974(+)
MSSPFWINSDKNSRTCEHGKKRIVDVGGQRSERKKWTHCFSEVQCVLFVCALSSFNQVLYEDASTNRLVESLNLFDEMCNSQFFQRTKMMLFLNKRDLFAEKLKKFDIRACPALESFNGDSKSFEETTNFIRECFFNLNKSAKTVNCHVTCATDRSNVNFVFNSVRDTVLKASLDSAIPGWQ